MLRAAPGKPNLSITLVRGLPGSGKTSFARAMTANLARTSFVEADQYFVDPAGNYEFKQAWLPEAHADCRQRTINLLGHQTSVLVANTFSQNWEMFPYAQLAYDYAADLYIVEMQGQWKSEHNVPDYAISRMKSRWESVDWTTINQIMSGELRHDRR